MYNKYTMYNILELIVRHVQVYGLGEKKRPLPSYIYHGVHACYSYYNTIHVNLPFTASFLEGLFATTLYHLKMIDPSKKHAH